jgi:riboflavin biosynthesis pyrimidine reductase
VIVTSVFPGDPVTFELPANRSDLDALYRTESAAWLRVNFVSSIDGSVVGDDGTSSSLSRGADRAILGAIRRSSDLVLVGATSVRTEGYVLPKTAPLAIVTSSGDLTGHAIPADADVGRVYVLCPPSAVERARLTLGLENAEFVVLPTAESTIAAGTMIDALHDRGFASIVCEGGPTLAGLLIAAKLVDELCLSVAPVVTGDRLPVLSGTFSPAPKTLTHLLIDDVGVSYSCWS